MKERNGRNGMERKGAGAPFERLCSLVVGIRGAGGRRRLLGGLEV